MRSGQYVDIGDATGEMVVIDLDDEIDLEDG